MSTSQTGGSLTHRATVAGVRHEAIDTVSVILEALGCAFPSFEPGAHVRVKLPGGIERSYSLCNRDPGSGGYTIAVKKEAQSRGGSAAVHALNTGDAVEIAGPFNLFPVDWSEKHLILVAGGIGITPLFSMAQEALRRGHSFELHYFSRSAEHAAFLADLQATGYDGRVHLHFGFDAQQVQACMDERLARVTQGDAVYVCGPRPLIDLARSIAGLHLPESAVHWESFSSDGEVLQSDGDAPFDIRLTDGRGPFHVPAGKTALQVLLDAGLDLPYSCREGECGMCVLDIAEGTPDHRDRFLSPAVRDSGSCMAICVSRAKTPLIILDY